MLLPLVSVCTKERGEDSNPQQQQQPTTDNLQHDNREGIDTSQHEMCHDGRLFSTLRASEFWLKHCGQSWPGSERAEAVPAL